MTTSFPASLDNFTNPTSSDDLDTPAVLHADQHANINDAVEALQAKVGIDSSAVTASLDYLVKSGSSSNPGHVHTSAAISDFNEAAQDAIGAMVDSSLVYTDATPLLSRAALTGDITASAGSNATTLATVNSNVGSFGSATQVGAFTVNAKGLITAASNTSISVTSSAVSDFTEAAQDAVGSMIDTTLVYTDGTPLLSRAALTGDVTASSGSNATTIANNAVSSAKFRQSAALSVVGNSTNATANVADIAAASDNQVLRRSGTAIGFGAVNIGSSNAVTGTLPVANGGTGTSTTFTAGQIIYAGASGVYTTTSTFVYDSASSPNRIGHGTSSPQVPFHVYVDTNGTNALMRFEQDGVGDSIIENLLTATVSWIQGIDNSDGDSFKWCPANDGFTSTKMSLTTGGIFNLNTDGALTLSNQTTTGGASTGTLTNAPSAGNPAVWLRIAVNGTTYKFPGWT